MATTRCRHRRLSGPSEERVARQRGQDELAKRHGDLGRSWAATEAFYRKQEGELERTMEVRCDWEQATAQSRRLALTADSELRRRHPGRRFEPLRSAEPVVTQVERDQLVLTLAEIDRKQPDAILQPSKPEIRPAAAVLERAAEIEAER
jgi:hypothetical protein